MGLNSTAIAQTRLQSHAFAPLAVRLRNIASHTLAPELLPGAPVVVDAGANVGEFSQALASEFNAVCFAIEPSPAICEKIPAIGGIRKFQCALAGTPREIELHLGRNPVATTMHRVESGEYGDTVRVPARTLEEFCRTSGTGRIDVLKMDIEGEELAVFESCSDAFLAGIDQVTVEFHEWIGQGTADDVRRVIRRMRGLGFYEFNMGRTVYCDVLFINGRRMSRASYLVSWLSLWVPRFFRGIWRRVAR
jgi:FkbM family methyltransferase